MDAMTIPDKQYVDWLVEQSMLNAARQRAKTYSGQGRLWQRPFALARPRDASAIASVWFTAYPASIVTREGGSVLEALGDETLWHALSEIGIQGIHNGPLKLSGGLKGRERTPSIDGNFDRISFGIDPDLGTEAQLLSLSRIAAAHNAVIIDDIIPSHTGKGADFRLAELAYEDYPGLFHMVEIREEDWPLLPEVPTGRDAVNLMPDVVDQLRDKHYIVGQLQRVIFFEPGVKETDWSATDVVHGVDGKARRWVYLHYFKDGQPSLNWLDPSFAAQQMIIGDALHAIDVMGARVLRLDANGFLGVERRAEGTAWSESHPLSITGNQLLAGAIRKAGGFSFQELNLTIDDIASMGQGGADLSYDFITRPAYQHALLTGTTEFLRLMLRQVHAYGIDPASLIHALQNHDELTLELVHFWTLHAHDTFHYQGQTFPGNILREHIREEMYEKLSGEHAPYNLKFVTNGVSCTTASIITAALGIRDLSTISDADIQQIQHIHLLLVMYNAMQPGVFALSGWDLVGALTLPAEQVDHLMQDGDTRWIHRGAYDLVDLDPEAEFSAGDMPRPKTLYGSLVSQLQRPDSFASQLKKILAVRRAYDIAASRQILIPDVEHPGLLVMVHELPAGKGTQITALNFSSETIVETLHLPGIAPGPVVDIINERVEGDLTDQGEFTITLDAYEGLALRVVSTLPI
ncbi:Trehalose synthase [Pseudomonas amygdali pv. photiniae]|uniref:Trehalose synthase n=5 Tax=Pseudomonas syringae group TaxID=136849 RepID=A0A9X0KTT4_PSESX|nr:Trehalose synthase [Pseudomonas syringae pv. daphniphylli]KPX34859.1 Trehalose synthase [Pseudomonas ficuserectae]KPX94139.1 Trehalose synthase [Pseudomonas amygdali pv. myricae]KPY09730.1 Trehalose synthase [Pseudomonas savastanoi pv. nerii]KPY40171.1 Trehalose synthase [Pseudomonas savastanoi pv. retacarpa]KPY79275.1 Glycosidase [Pseudomonas savastanoi pv. savastanoi]RMO19359.1 Glycosidase [Pseudomonas amygdali pv. morsprunorum]RMP15415.1 Trehalose synthase [Pseudomonas syringae pv. per